jgi:hypothetical protein
VLLWFSYRVLAPHKFMPVPGVHISVNADARERAFVKRHASQSKGAVADTSLSRAPVTFDVMRTLQAQTISRRKPCILCSKEIAIDRLEHRKLRNERN